MPPTGFDAISSLPISTLPAAGGAPSFPPGDDSDSWFSGVAYHFVAVPLAIAAVALGTSVAIAGNFNRFNDDVPRATVFEDDSWQQRDAYPFRITVSGPVWDDQVPVKPAVEEFYWWKPEVGSSAVYTLYLPDPEQSAFARATEEQDWLLPKALSPPITASLWLVDDALPVTAVTIVDEDAWAIPTALPLTANLTTPWSEQDWVPVYRADEDYWWRAQTGTYLTYAQPLSDDGNFVPVFRADEDYDWRAQVGSYLVYPQPFTDDGNFVRYFQADEDYDWRAQVGSAFTYSQPIRDDAEWVPVFRADEDYWPQYVTAIVQPWLEKPWWSDEQIVVQPGTLFPDEDFWPPLTSLPATVSTLYLPDPEQSVFVAVVEDFYDWKPQVGSAITYAQPWAVDDNFANAFVPDEESWRPLGVTQASPIAVLWAIGDDLPVTPVTIVEEDAWVIPATPQFVANLTLPWNEQDWVPVFRADEDYWWQAQVGTNVTYAQLWSVDDDLPVTPVTIVEEDFWAPPSILPAATFIQSWVDQDFAPTRQDEDYWWQAQQQQALVQAPIWADDAALPVVAAFEGDQWAVYTPNWANPLVTLWAIEDEVFPPPPTISVEETEWLVYTPPYPPTQPLYLPDPEEIPAGSLIPPAPVVEVGNDGAVWPLPKYPQRQRQDIEREQKLVQDYLDELDRRAQKAKALERAPARTKKRAAALLQIVPLLTIEMAQSASDDQIRRILASAAAEEDRKRARAEYERRYWAAFLALAMMD